MLNYKMAKVQYQGQTNQCPECNDGELIRDEGQGEVVCNACGLVVSEDMFDRSPDWRAFTRKENQTKPRVGPPTKFNSYDKGLTTTLWITRDFLGRLLPVKTRYRMLRLKKWNRRAKSYTSIDRNLMQAMSELERLSELLHIPSSVQETAAVIYRKAFKKDLVKGRSIASIIAASLYAACRLTRTPKTLKDVVKQSTQDRKAISRCYRMLLRVLELRMPIHDPLKYIPKITAKIKIPGDVQGLAIKILRKAKIARITMGKDPVCLAAAALYLASEMSHKKLTQKAIADAAGVTEVTIRSRKRELEITLDGLLDDIQVSIPILPTMHSKPPSDL